MTMVVQLASRRAAPTTPAKGTPDPIQLHAEAHNALAMALHYLRTPAGNVPGAARKAVQALAALRGLQTASAADAADPCRTCPDNFPLPQPLDYFDRVVVEGYVERRTACDKCPANGKPCLAVAGGAEVAK